MTISVTVDALVLVEWGGALREGDGVWQANVTCSLAPYQAGQRILGTDLQQLELLGLQTWFTEVLSYPGVDAPAAQQVGMDMLQWVGKTHAAAAAKWVGKQATALVAAMA